MEKIVIISDRDCIGAFDVHRINDYLEEGWRVKDMQTVATNEYVTAIFVLETD